VATPAEFNVAICVAEPTVNPMLPDGAVEPVAGATVALSIYGPPAVNVPPLGVMDNWVVVGVPAGPTSRETTVVMVRFPEVPAMITG
jgi:hypothetical protein